LRFDDLRFAYLRFDDLRFAPPRFALRRFGDLRFALRRFPPPAQDPRVRFLPVRLADLRNLRAPPLNGSGDNAPIFPPAIPIGDVADILYIYSLYFII